MKSKIIILVSSIVGICVSATAFAGNYGHRGGAGSTGYYADLAENSLEALHVILAGRNGGKPLQDNAKFAYLEFDIRETYDHKLVISHDPNLDRVINWESAPKGYLDKLLKNADVLKRHGVTKLKRAELLINKLYLSELQTFDLKNGTEPMPLLEDYLLAAELFRLRKPMVAEIKHIDSDQARQESIDLLYDFNVRYFRDVAVKHEKGFDFKQDLTVMAFATNFDATYGKIASATRKYWCEAFRLTGFLGVFTPVTHARDNCAGQLTGLN